MGFVRTRPPAAIRVYKYGCLPPLEGADTMEDQFHRAHKYRNKLCEVELWRQEARQAVLREMCPEFVAAEAERESLRTELTAVRTAIKAARQSTRSRTPATAEQTASIKDLVARIKLSGVRLSELRVAAKENSDIAARRKAVDEEAGARKRAARAESGLYSGTYLLVEAAAAKWKTPHYVGWLPTGRGSGRLGVQLQKGLLWADLYSPNRLAYLEVVPHRGRTPHVLVHLRVLSDADHKPVWAVFPAVLHRDPAAAPAETRITWVTLIRRRVAYKDTFEIQFTIEQPVAPVLTPSPDLPCAAIDLGWRKIEQDHLRIGYLVDSAGHREELRLPALPAGVPMDDFDRVDQLVEIRRRRFNEVLPLLADWTRTNKPVLPEWFVTATATLPQWKSPSRLYWLAHRWRHNRFAGDSDIFPLVEEFSHKERHLYDWEANARHQGGARRDDFYRKLALRLVGTYREISIERFKLPDVLRRPAPEEVETSATAIRRNAHTAATGRFRLFLKAAAPRTGCVIVEKNAAYTSRICPSCHGRLDGSAKLQVTCPVCTRKWDQDELAGHNLLLPEAILDALVRERPSDEPTATT